MRGQRLFADRAVDPLPAADKLATAHHRGQVDKSGHPPTSSTSLLNIAPATREGGRAAIALALINGFWMMRKVIGSTALNDADDAELTRILEQRFQVLVDQDMS